MDLENQALSDVNGGMVSGTASEGARRATGEAVPGAAMRPEPEVVAVAKRRRFSMGHKRRVVRAADACKEPGEVGALLRREGIYSSHLCQWRKEIAVLEEAVESAKKRGPKPEVAKAEGRRILALQQELARLRQKLGRAEQIIEAQKKLCEVLGLPTAEEAPR
jgi:transposase